MLPFCRETISLVCVHTLWQAARPKILPKKPTLPATFLMYTNRDTELYYARSPAVLNWMYFLCNTFHRNRAIYRPNIFSKYCCRLSTALETAFLLYSKSICVEQFVVPSEAEGRPANRFVNFYGYDFSSAVSRLRSRRHFYYTLKVFVWSNLLSRAESRDDNKRSHASAPLGMTY